MPLLSSNTFALLRASHGSWRDVARHWRYRLDRALRRTGPKATSPDIVAARAAFERASAHGEFSTTWFDASIPVWVPALAPHARATHPARVLEIGSWEGRSTLFFLSYLPGSHVTAVDSFAGGDEHAAGYEVSATERRFDANVAPFTGRVTKRKGLSGAQLAALVAEGGERFDVVYVDGSHFADDTLLDALLGWRLLMAGGTMIFDDYLWRFERYGLARNPSAAVHLFLKLVAADHAVLHAGHQVLVRKTRSLTHYTG
jgi:predicted O-methyltransferase YrrM